MMVTGFVAIVIGLFLGIVMDRGQFSMIEQLHDNAVIFLDKKRMKQLRSDLRITAIIGQLIPLLALFVIFIVQILDPTMTIGELMARPGGIVALICVTMVSIRVGRWVSNSFTCRVVFCSDERMPLRLPVTHPDRCGGLSVLGTFYLRQASIALVPAFWALSWILIISYDEHLDSGVYSECSDLLPWLVVGLLVCIFVSVGGFAFAMLPINRRIVSWKRDYSSYASKLRGHLHATIRQLHHSGYTDTQDQLEAHSMHLFRLAQISNWGISPDVRIAIYVGVATICISTVVSFVIATFFSNSG